MLLHDGFSEPEFYGELVYKFKKLIGRNDFSFQFRKFITRYRHIDSLYENGTRATFVVSCRTTYCPSTLIVHQRRIGFNLNIIRQSACLVFNPIMDGNYDCTPVGRASDSMMAFFNCTPVGRASDSMMAPT